MPRQRERFSLRPPGTDRVAARARVQLLSLWCAAFVVALSAGALAQGPARVLLVGGGDATFTRRVRAEAEAAGLVVIEPDQAAEASELLGHYGSPALIRLSSADSAEIHMSLADGAMVRTLARHGDDRDAFAVRIVEEVYARLVELNLVQPRAASERSAPPAPPATAEPGPGAAPVATPANPPLRSPNADRTLHAGDQWSKLWLLGGIAGTWPAGAIGATAQGMLGAELEPARRVTLAARAFLPLTENNLVEKEGSADVNVSLFTADAAYTLFEPGSAVSVGAGLGAGVLVLDMQGEATAPLAGQSERTTAALGFVQANLAWSAASWLRFRLSLLGGSSAPRPVVRFADREVAAWGRLFVAAALSSEFGLTLSGSEAKR